MKRGFSFVELLVVTTIILLLAGSVIVGYNGFTNRQRVKQAALTLKSDLRVAQAKALAGQKPASEVCTKLIGYTIAFGADRYTIAPTCSDGNTYEAETRIVMLPVGLTASSSVNPITLFALSGSASVNSDITISNTGSTVTYTIIVSKSGAISEE